MRFHTEVVREYEINSVVLGIVSLIGCAFIFWSCIAYLINFCNGVTWDLVWVIPIGYFILFVLAIILILLTAILTVVAFVEVASADNFTFIDEYYTRYKKVAYFIDNKIVDEDTYKKEKERYDKIMEPFLTTLKEQAENK